ncbi:MAG: enoyl-CoA hydratase/isomerase family protein [Promethearchaeota archaeon]|jgi:2-(1,2-epoxy-1,2-dihydrophenyl)acetyl-CoA isomerase
MVNYEIIETEIDEANKIATVFLNRPTQLNAFNIQHLDELISFFTEISNNHNIRCLIISGRGKAFCAGGDVAEFRSAENPSDFMANMASRLHRGIKILKNMDQLTIAAINGACFGAGLGYASACDFRISSESATFGCAFTRIGLSPDSSTTFHLPKLVGLGLANEMLFFNRTLNAQEALQNKLINKIVSSGSFIAEVKEVVGKLCKGAPIAFAFTKKLLNESFTNDIESHLDREAEQIVKTAGSVDFQEGLRAFFEKRKPNFTGK